MNQDNKHEIMALLIVPALLGFVLGTAGITLTDWQLYVVMILGAFGQTIGWAQGWKACTKKERDIDAMRKRMCEKGVCPHARKCG